MSQIKSGKASQFQSVNGESNPFVNGESNQVVNNVQTRTNYANYCTNFRYLTDIDAAVECSW